VVERHLYERAIDLSCRVVEPKGSGGGHLALLVKHAGQAIKDAGG
jgi:hypothetical protein